MSRQDDAVLVAGALAGSQDACRRLVERYERPIYGLILRMVRDHALAEELAQESFIKAFGALSRFDPRWKLASWLFKIAHNTAIDHLRKKEPTTVSLSAPAADDEAHGTDYGATLADPESRNPERDAESADLARELDRALEELRPEYREVMVLRFQEGLAYEEIAQVLDLPLGTVKTHIHRARRELAKRMSAAGWGPRSPR